MKIRIKSDSVRLRLTQSEVKSFEAEGHISAQTHFNEQVFTYQLKATDASSMTATFKDSTITINIPNSQIQGWYDNAIVGFDTNQILQDGTSLHLLVEKDFVCLDETVEDQSDNFPNPRLEE
ncbi:MAG: hypothetical protein HKN09_10540 [Saprospiraceae bacterium]|nr:hypothetical protein [Saprospiraceae bacterium]